MFIIPIKKKYFDMIASGEKKEEYREIKPFYTSRLAAKWMENYVGLPYSPDDKEIFIEWLKEKGTVEFGLIFLRNGYSTKCKTISSECTLRIGTGKTEWGAETGKEYYVFGIKDVQKCQE